ncbi:hypothetical protein F511_08327 [Dorcoceras hygrometricum]|uniref:Uncharacterized protein n=1 Tax=Dorcoceras hygrometricum TaxID=472368 RepID=A0A2Z7D9G6_9LAMI|nr:hypothetical protein F511_08327 [Dorcoceras hygrometricum]
MTSAFLLLRRAGISNDDVTISRWIRRSAKEKLLTDEKNKGEVEVAFSSKRQYIHSQATVQPVESYSGFFNQPLELNVSEHLSTGRTCVQRIEFEQRLFKGEDLKEEANDFVRIQKNTKGRKTETKQSTSIREERTTSVDC